MSEVIHQLVVRRRRDEQLPYPQGYDEFIGQTPTGKIVLGWKIVDGVIVYEYAPMTKDEADARHEIPCELPIPNAETQAAMEEARGIAHAHEGEMTERYVVSFSWHYGDDEVVVPKLSDAIPTRKGIEVEYRGFAFTNWKIRREVVFTTEMDAGIVMTKEEKLRVHLEEIIFEDLPEDTPLTSAEIMARCAAATTEQHERAYARALVHSPLLLEDER